MLSVNKQIPPPVFHEDPFVVFSFHWQRSLKKLHWLRTAAEKWKYGLTLKVLLRIPSKRQKSHSIIIVSGVALKLLRHNWNLNRQYHYGFYCWLSLWLRLRPLCCLNVTSFNQKRIEDQPVMDTWAISRCFVAFSSTKEYWAWVKIQKLNQFWGMI